MLKCPEWSFGRVCLMGDAAFALRPHAAVGDSQGGRGRRKLGRALQAAQGDLDRCSCGCG